MGITRTRTVINVGVALSCLGLVACNSGGGGGGGGTVDGIVVPASWDFDDGSMQGWALWPGQGGQWHVSDASDPVAPNSLRYADSITGVYGDNELGFVSAPEIILGAAPVLNVEHFLANECSETNSDPDGTLCANDIVQLGISTNGGLSFLGIDYLGTSSAGLLPNTFDLSAYANTKVVLAVVFNSDGLDNGHAGAALDNISVPDAVVTHTIRTNTSSVVTTEAGGTDTFDVVLNTAPAAGVTIAISSDKSNEALVMGGDSPATYIDSIIVTFTTANWNVPQTVSVQGQADGVLDGNNLYNVVLAPATSLDTLYNGVDAADIAAVNIDDGVGLAAGCDVVDLTTLGDDDSQEVAIGFSFNFQGVAYDTVHVGSNGYLTFGAGDTDLSESVAELLSQEPRIAALWDDLDPSSAGSVSCINNITDSMTVSFAGVPQWGGTDSNSFDITLNSDGSVVIAYGSVAAMVGLAGVSPGLDLATDPGEVDLSLNPNQSATGVTYELFDAGDNDLSGATLTFTPAP